MDTIAYANSVAIKKENNKKGEIYYGQKNLF